MNVSSKVPASYDGTSISVYLAGRFTYLPEEAWCQMVNDGRIYRNDVPCDRMTVVAGGDTIRCDLPEFAAPEVNLDYTIVYEDEWLLGINKPAGLRVHSRGRFVNANLMHHLRYVRRPAYPEASLVNRLDADTSGLVLVARNPAALRRLMRQFAEGTVVKRYLAVVKGRPSPAAGTIDLPIGPVAGALIPRFGINRRTGKAAETRYVTVRPLAGNVTLLELYPRTGRTHQLRVHLAAIGHPIAGDALYTMSDRDYLAWRRNPTPRHGLQRQALHCHQLQFIHPILQTVCCLNAPLAIDLEQFIQGASTADSALERVDTIKGGTE
jgi:RluA family pseudouridine synthase